MSHELLGKCEATAKKIRNNLFVSALAELFVIFIVKLVAKMQPECADVLVYFLFGFFTVMVFSMIYNVMMCLFYTFVKPFRNPFICIGINVVYYSSIESIRNLQGVPEDDSTGKGVYWIYGPYGGKHFVDWR